MAGGATTVELVAAVSQSGALGSFGAASMTPQQILDAAAAVRERTEKPFAFNLFSPLPDPPDADLTAMIELLSHYHAELGMPAPSVPPVYSSRAAFDAQLDAVIESGAPIFSFTFGIVPPAALQRLRSRGIRTIGTATTVAEARALEDAGVDAIVAQGSEAGGHRGTFLGPFESAMIGTLALVPQIVDAVSVAVIASGGIMDGRGIVASRVLGAAGAQLGTAFLTCDESGLPQAYKDAILAASEDGTAITRAFSGRPARGLVNRAMREIEASGAIAPYPMQNALTRAMRAKAGADGRTDYLSLWSGQAPRLARRQSAAALVRRLVAESLRARNDVLGEGADSAVD